MIEDDLVEDGLVGRLSRKVERHREDCEPSHQFVVRSCEPTRGSPSH